MAQKIDINQFQVQHDVPLPKDPGEIAETPRVLVESTRIGESMKAVVLPRSLFAFAVKLCEQEHGYNDGHIARTPLRSFHKVWQETLARLDAGDSNDRREYCIFQQANHRNRLRKLVALAKQALASNAGLMIRPTAV